MDAGRQHALPVLQAERAPGRQRRRACRRQWRRRRSSWLADAHRDAPHDLFDGAAGQWDRVRDELFGRRGLLLGLLGLLDPKLAVADLGCGTGAHSEALAPVVQRVFAVDGSEAMLDAAIPQTAAIKRDATIEVTFDGEPKFEPIEETTLHYAVNTESQVIRAGDQYFCAEQGVWYVAKDPKGPWKVATEVPDEIRTIPASNPNYNTKYVYIYDYTPEVVYVGYTPGYVGSYVYQSTVFYGSGWYYRPWVSPHYYYPHHSTWGFHVRYDPWYGWNFGLSWAWGPFSVAYWPGGHWHQGEMALDQFLMLRPVPYSAQYQTPVAGLFLCGAGCHPGGDLTGAPGYNAAQEILR